MPLVSRSGSLPQTSPLPGETAPSTTADLLDRASFVETSASQRTAFNPNLYPDTHGALLGYLDGNRLPVRYFLRAQQPGDDRSQTMDASSGRHSNHTRYVQILNYELTFLGDGAVFSFDPEKTEINVRGEAVTYPGLNPNKGDYFVLDVGDGNFGLCTVTEVEPLSFRTGRCHKITFKLQDYANQDKLQLLIDQSSQTLFFDKQLYLGDASTMLAEDQYRYLQQLRALRVNLAQRHHQLFYDADSGTVMPPHGIYDPYVVAFLQQKIPFSVNRVRLEQLWPDVEASFSRSVWGRLLDHDNLSLKGMWSTTVTQTVTELSFAAFITPLLNRPYLQLVKPPVPATPPLAGEDDSYLLTAAFYAGDLTQMTPLDRLAHTIITTRLYDDWGGLLTTFLNKVPEEEEDDLFYLLPLYLHAIDVALATKARPVDTMV